MEKKTKKFMCGTKDNCAHKNNYINNRCFAPYVVRQSCPYLIRNDKKTWRAGSKEEEALS